MRGLEKGEIHWSVEVSDVPPIVRVKKLLEGIYSVFMISLFIYIPDYMQVVNACFIIGLLDMLSTSRRDKKLLRGLLTFINVFVMVA